MATRPSHEHDNFSHPNRTKAPVPALQRAVQSPGPRAQAAHPRLAASPPPPPRKCVDAQGRTTYTDQPCPGGARARCGGGGHGASSVVRCYFIDTRIGTISSARGGRSVSYEEDILIKTVVYQMALVLDRELIYHERERIKLAMESEHLKSTLLRSISHDIRTPLTGIIGASKA